jgi:hypothetical protein
MSTHHPHGIHQGSRRRLSFTGWKPAAAGLAQAEPARQVAMPWRAPTMQQPTGNGSVPMQDRRAYPSPHHALEIETLVSTTPLWS